MAYYKGRQIIYTNLFRSGILLRWIHLLFRKDLTSSNLKHEFVYLPLPDACLKVLWKIIEPQNDRIVWVGRDL